MTLEELAARVEALTGPCRETDVLIALAAEVVPSGYEEARGMGDWREIYGNGYWTAPAFTASIDAAMSLVPEDAWWAVEMYPLDRGAYVAECGDASSRAATPALALTAAALRARAAMEADDA